MGNFMSDKYVMPEIEVLTPEEAPVAKKAPVKLPGSSPKEEEPSSPPQQEIALVVVEREFKANEMWNDNRDGLEAIIVERISRHLNYVAGFRGYATDRDMENEQLTFINTFMNAVNNKEYELARLFMLEMIRQMRPMYSTLHTAAVFRFQERIRRTHPQFDFQGFQTCFSNLIDISGNWGGRREYCRGRDYRYILRYFSSGNAKYNVGTFFQNVPGMRL